ncbi:S1 family peptidase [Conexibacter arvalis]|uniref:Peptidase S1 domain-containing protein n=1 Tax=Conexibacter arvalis TaxID=912552 RepID=A0A840IM61_9ACTN|nr:serine protease [Conexibacter arvalis]MBB4664950.1 hypothetical protein [Conexibacter arvalis]
MPRPFRPLVGLAPALLLLLLPALAAAAAPPRQQHAIVGGTPAADGTFGPLAFVTSQTSATTAIACTGTVIAPAIVLTAAHCLLDAATGAPRPAGGVVVTVGRLDRRAPGGQLLTAARLLVHPAYDPRELRADLALIVLSSAAAASPLAVAGADDAGLAVGGATATIAGWGLSAPSAATAAQRLLTATTTILDAGACRRLLGAGFDPVGTLCVVDAPAFAAATCRGDSGGPLIVLRPDGTPVVVGVTSWGSQDCDPRVPQAFTRLSTYAGWIASQVASSPTPPEPPPAPVAAVPTAETRGDGGPPAARAVAPRGGEPAAAHPRTRAGWYRGRTAQRRAVAVDVAAGGRAVATVRVTLAGRCAAPRARSASSRASGSAAGRTVAARGAAVRRTAAPPSRRSLRTAVLRLPARAGRLTDGSRFAAPGDAARGVRLRVAGRFAGDVVHGSVRATWRDRAARCATGPVAFSARR